MTTQFFKRSLFCRLIVCIIIANFIFGNGPIGYCSRALAADSLRGPAEKKQNPGAPEFAEALRQKKVSESIVVWFKDLRKGDVPFVGGKNANLGELIHFLGDIIPDGFAVAVKGFQSHLKNNFVTYEGKQMTLGDFIYARTANLNYADDIARAEAASDIQEAIIKAVMPGEVEAYIREYYAKLSELAGEKEAEVAVRSSATAEDLPEASFAGQQATFLYIRGISNVLEATKKCLASLYEQRAMAYRHNQGIAENKAFLSVGIQLMAHAEKSGIMFNTDIKNGSPGITINGGPGLGEPWVSGSATPDQYELVYDAKTGKPRYWKGTVGSKLFKIVRAPGGGTQHVETTEQERKTFCLTVEEVEQLGNVAQAIEKYYGRRMDIEWVIERNGKIRMVQARPDTVWADNPLVHRMDFIQVPDGVASREKLLARVKGYAVSPRAGVGRVRIIRDVQVIDPVTKQEDKRATSMALAKELARVQSGDILVSRMTSPDFVEAMKRAAGVVTNQGGIASHAGIVTRELKIPAVVGTGNATEVLQEDELVTVDSKGGYVAEKELPLVQVRQLNNLAEYPTNLKTKIGLIMSEPRLAMSLWKFGNWIGHGGIGLIRDEHFLLSQILKHPQAVIDYDNYYDPNYVPKPWQHDKEWIKEHVIDVAGEAIAELIKGYTSFKAFYIDVKKNGLVELAKAQAGGQRVLYRTADFKSNEYRNLPLGSEYEPDEPNPMAGNRGIYRVLTPAFNEVFRLDLQAVKEARKLRSNIDVMFPVVRTAEDIRAGVQIMAEEGLFDGEDKPKIAMMVELASNVLMVEEMYGVLAELAQKYGTKAKMSIGSNDLTQFILGVDRDSGKMAEYANFWDPAVKKGIEVLIKTAKKYGIETGICGEAPSRDPKFAAFLVECGIDTISVSPESYEQVVKVVAEAEKRLEGKPFNPTIEDWEYPSQLEIKPLPRIVAEQLDASEIIQVLGIHPLLLISTGQYPFPEEVREAVKAIRGDKSLKDLVVDRVSGAILEKVKVVGAETPIIFTTDTNQSAQYKKMIAGKYFETDDENPYLAFCGLVRVVDPRWEDFFRWQLQGVKKARDLSGHKNIGIRFDLAITTDSVRRALEIMKEEGLVPGQDGLMVGMEISRGGHFLVLNQYLDLGLNFISENFHRFTSYVLPEDPGNPYLQIPMDRKQRQFINGQKIWTNIAAGRGVPLVQFEGEAKAVEAQPAAPVGLTPVAPFVPTTSGMPSGSAARGAAGVELNAEAVKLRRIIEMQDTTVYNGSPRGFDNVVNSMRGLADTKGALVIGANAIFKNAGTLTALSKIREAKTDFQVAVWAQDEAAADRLKVMGVEEVADIISSEGLEKLLDELSKLGIAPERITLINSELENIDLQRLLANRQGLKVLNVQAPNAKDVSLNSMPLIFARAIAGIFQNEESVVKPYQELVQNYQESGQISAEDLAVVNDLTARISTVPLVKVSQEIAEAQVVYEETVGEI